MLLWWESCTAVATSLLVLWVSQQIEIRLELLELRRRIWSTFASLRTRGQWVVSCLRDCEEWVSHLEQVASRQEVVSC